MQITMNACPFCGHDGTQERTHDTSDYWVPRCSNALCGCRLCAYLTRGEAAKAWNERAAVTVEQPMRFPNTAGQLLAHIERCGAADEWILSTDPASPVDQCQRLRRTFRLHALGDAECGVVAEFGNLFLVLADGRFDCLLQDLRAPDRLRDVIACKAWAESSALAFVDALERLFPESTMAPRRARFPTDCF